MDVPNSSWGTFIRAALVIRVEARQTVAVCRESLLKEWIPRRVDSKSSAD